MTVDKYHIGGIRYNPGTAAEVHEQNRIPVSYTHLDVYKRQDKIRTSHIQSILNGLAEWHMTVPPLTHLSLIHISLCTVRHNSALHLQRVPCRGWRGLSG